MQQILVLGASAFRAVRCSDVRLSTSFDVPRLPPQITRSSFPAPVAQLDRASDYGSEGLRFESPRARALSHDRSDSSEAANVLPAGCFSLVVKKWTQLLVTFFADAFDLAQIVGGFEWTRRDNFVGRYGADARNPFEFLFCRRIDV